MTEDHIYNIATTAAMYALEALHPPPDAATWILAGAYQALALLADPTDPDAGPAIEQILALRSHHRRLPPKS